MTISLNGWIGRLIAQPDKALQRPEPVADAAALNKLTLRLAACKDLLVDLPVTLGFVQDHLYSLRYVIEEPRLCLAFRMSQTHPLNLLTPPGEALSPEQTTAMEYPLAEAAVSGHDGVVQRLAVPSWPHPVRALRLLRHDDGACAWLLLTDRNEQGGAQDECFEALRKALASGLSICLAHQRRREDAIEKERREYAAELHDSIAQELGYLRLRTARLEQACTQRSTEELTALAADIHLQTQRAYRQTRELISSARITLEEGSLHLGLMHTVEEFEQRSGLVFELDDRAHPVHLSKPVAIQVLLIVREALSNCVRHAHATHVRIQLLPRADGCLLVRVEDNGLGFVQEHIGRSSFGLGIMHDRARKIGGSLHLGQRPGGGTRVELSVDREA